MYQVLFRSDISFLRYCAETKKLTPGRTDNIHHIISRVRLRRNSAKKGYYEQAALQNDLRLGEDTMKLQTETVHLGLIRTTSNETKINIVERISLARRTLYSLIKSDVHGTNGLNPRTSYKSYQVYVIPRLLYGLETLHLLKKDLELLTNFHLNTIERLQALPNRTATVQHYIFYWEPPQY